MTNYSRSAVVLSTAVLSVTVAVGCAAGAPSRVEFGGAPGTLCAVVLQGEGLVVGEVVSSEEAITLIAVNPIGLSGAQVIGAYVIPLPAQATPIQSMRLDAPVQPWDERLGVEENSLAPGRYNVLLEIRRTSEDVATLDAIEITYRGSTGRELSDIASTSYSLANACD